jgi:hypothetical protein
MRDDEGDETMGGEARINWRVGGSPAERHASVPEAKAAIGARFPGAVYSDEGWGILAWRDDEACRTQAIGSDRSRPIAEILVRD